MRILFLSSHPLGEAAARFTWGIMGDHQFSWSIADEKFDFDAYNEPYDLGVSFLYNHLIPASQIKDKNWINFHPAPLPKYRGRNVAYHALLNGETWFGATLHYADATFDTGDIIEVFPFEITYADTAGDVAERARWTCLTLFKKYLPRFLAGEKPKGYPQTGGVYYKKRPINPYINLPEEYLDEIRAITAPPHYPKILIGGKDYVIIPESKLHHSDNESSGDARQNLDATV